ncbi:MAG: helicase-related protein [Nanoarchaeota archaeon]
MSVHDPLDIASRYKDPTLNLALDTMDRGKQALIFVSSKRSAEKVALDVAAKKEEKHPELAKAILSALSQPTEQCRKLAKAVARGIAFHHAGLAPKQKSLVEDAFRDGIIKIISCTPTLAAGLDMPAFRTIIRDLKRFSGRWGMQYIPVLEYQQMAGRAGRPGKEEYGEAICIASDQGDKDTIIHTFLRADVEPIYSKLAVEPVLRTYVLSLVASGFVANKADLIDFFSQTFWARQYGDMHKLETIISRVQRMLQKYGFLEGGKSSEDELGFSTGTDLLEEQDPAAPLKATPLGQRVAQLYLDPLTAHGICQGLMTEKQPHEMAYLQLLCDTLEMQPLLRVGKREVEAIEDQISLYKDAFFTEEPSFFDMDYQEYLNSIKTALCMRDWIDEAGENLLLERYSIRPGELRGKLERLDWLFYCATELAKATSAKKHVGALFRMRTRLKHGARAELLPLLRFRNIGRVRARKLFSQGLEDSGDLRSISIERLSGIVGEKIAQGIKEQLGEQKADFSPLS